METSELVGMAAAVLTMLSTVPQVMKSIKTRSTHDLSWGWLAITTSALFLWVIYGMMISSLPVVVANSVSGALFVALIALKFKYG